jgi:hypothetical protein
MVPARQPWDAESDRNSVDGSDCGFGSTPLPSVGSELHSKGDCKRCCFYPRGRCANGFSCDFCHYDHEKRQRKNKKKKSDRKGDIKPIISCVEVSSTGTTGDAVTSNDIDAGCCENEHVTWSIGAADPNAQTMSSRCAAWYHAEQQSLLAMANVQPPPFAFSFAGLDAPMGAVLHSESTPALVPSVEQLCGCDNVQRQNLDPPNAGLDVQWHTFGASTNVCSLVPAISSTGFAGFAGGFNGMPWAPPTQPPIMYEELHSETPPAPSLSPKFQGLGVASPPSLRWH